MPTIATSDGTEIFYKDWGSGEPIVSGHGWALSADDWESGSGGLGARSDGMADEVAIVGAGPTGLLLAGDLAAAGVPCTVLERRAGESNLTRAFGVHARTLELLDARGLADELLGAGTTVGRLH